MTVETDQELALLRAIGAIVADCMHHMADALEPGLTTGELDAVGAQFLETRGALSAPRVTYNFPGATCISINEEVAHGIPGERRIESGDLVHIDVSASKDGYFADTGATFIIGEASDIQKRVCAAGRCALDAAMSAARTGARLRDVGRAMEEEATQAGFRVIRNLCSHGIGRALHEEPESICAYESPRETRTLSRGQVLTLEPFVTDGEPIATQAADGWTLLNRRGAWTAQYEHTLVITDCEPIVLTEPSGG